jgi:hypothetical protein
MYRQTDHLQRLERHHDLVVLGKIADDHQQFLGQGGFLRLDRSATATVARGGLARKPGAA